MGCRQAFLVRQARVLTLHPGLTDRFYRQVEIQPGHLEPDPCGKRVAVWPWPHLVFPVERVAKGGIVYLVY